MRDRNFLQSILPVSDELNTILQRIFEVNPHRRITLAELRDLVIRCPRLTTTPGSSLSTAPPTPPYSPVVDKPMDEPNVTDLYDPVPRLDLPAQQFPPTPSLQPEYYHGSHQTQGPVILTPPSSGQCSPQPTLYTIPPKSVGVAPAVHHHQQQQQTSGMHFFGGLPDFRRCGQMFSNFNMPATNHMWTPTY